MLYHSQFWNKNYKNQDRRKTENTREVKVLHFTNIRRKFHGRSQFFTKNFLFYGFDDTDN